MEEEFSMRPIIWSSPWMEKALDLRREVFVSEQNVPEALEIDEHDRAAFHLLMLKGDEAVATLRLVPHGESIKIGRVAVKRECRNKGLGARLMKMAIEHAARGEFEDAILDAQLDSMPFYEKLGFVAEGEIFMDAGIPHKRMRLKL
jgi:predicted GNAT family N-acyltransferase